MNQRLVRQFDKRSGNTYFYTEEKITDPVTGEVKVKRHIAGKLAEDGSMIPTGKKGRPKRIEDDSPYKEKHEAVFNLLKQKQEENEFLRKQIRDVIIVNEEIIRTLKEQNMILQRLLGKE